MSKIFAQILLPLALNDPFTYKSEESIACGDVVRVEFGRKEIWGVVVGLQFEAPQNFSEAKVKPILEVK